MSNFSIKNAEDIKCAENRKANDTMTKADLELKVKELEQQIKQLQQDCNDMGDTAEAYEISALHHATLLHELGIAIQNTNFPELLHNQLANGSNLKLVNDNKLRELIKEKIQKSFGKIPGEIELFKSEKRGTYGCMYKSNNIYGGFVCAVYRVSTKNKSVEQAYRQNGIPTKDTALLCLDMLMKAAIEDRYRFTFFYDDDIKANAPGHCNILFPSEILEMYKGIKGFYAIITFGGMTDPKPYGVHIIRERYNAVDDITFDYFESLSEARTSMSDVVDEGLAIIRAYKDQSYNDW